ncbi:aspartate/glutamate racemase family protein [Sporosarcina sp. P33]|uniref:aspartate/glutamate racemase family protein n=1 Tax=Sporosarcina sp. P33 TaxID=1930764 RepID=UPI0009BF131C|nr:aspartate/glutamate racemase family protein [Sporosarcina sp. P33]ARD49059.1 hypothetical protein SporoP33_12980 [Sporosarcina sp. P33]
MKIGILHATPNAVEPLNKAIKQLLPESIVLNFVNEHIQYYANEIKGIDDKVCRDFVQMANTAQEAEVDVIIVACTVLTPIVDLVKPFVSIPIIAVDKPMLDLAVTNYTKIGVVATNAPSGPATKKQLEGIAKEQNKQIIVETAIDTQAMIELKSGEIANHNELNVKAAQKLKDLGCEVIILAQITQAVAEERVKEVGLPVLTSPTEAAKTIKKLI